MEPTQWIHFDNRAVFEITNSEMDFTRESTITVFRIPHTKYTFIIVLLCIVGIPANLFVVAVYLRRMTTSIRAYMFALGIADTLICVCFTIEYTRIGNFGHLVYVYVHNTSLIFSTVLLAFLATDRCLAVSKPHLFSLSTRRAISALVTIAIVSVCYSAIIFLAKMFALGRTHAVLITCMAGVCFLTTVTSYGIMAVLLLMRTKTARRRVGVVPLTQGVASTSRSTGVISTSVSRHVVSTSGSTGVGPTAALTGVVSTTGPISFVSTSGLTGVGPTAALTGVVSTTGPISFVSTSGSKGVVSISGTTGEISTQLPYHG